MKGPSAVGRLALRLLAYTILQGTILLGYAAAAQAAGERRLGGLTLAGLLRENRWLEWAQIALLAAISAALLTWRTGPRRPLARLLAGAALVALARELDSLLEGALFEHAHSVLMAIVGLATIVVVWRDRARIAPELAAFVGRAGFYLMGFGATLLIVYAQVLGQRDLWRLLAEEDLLSEAKRFVEEGLEFMGYVLIGCGVVEERWFGSAPSEPSARP